MSIFLLSSDRKSSFFWLPDIRARKEKHLGGPDSHYIHCVFFFLEPILNASTEEGVDDDDARKIPTPNDPREKSLPSPMRMPDKIIFSFRPHWLRPEQRNFAPF